MQRQSTHSVQTLKIMARTVRIQTLIHPAERLKLGGILNALGLSEAEWLRGAAKAQMRRDERRIKQDLIQSGTYTTKESK